MKNEAKEYLVVGAGISGAVYARLAANKGINVTVIEKSNKYGGAMADHLDTEYNCFVQEYGPHIFHCNNDKVWKFVNQFTLFNEYNHYVKTLDKNKEYPFPINFETMSKVFKQNIFSKEKAEEVIFFDKVDNDDSKLVMNPGSFEEVGVNMVGPTLYKKFFKNYTEKQWKMPCSELSGDMLKRVPLRYNRNNTYFDAKYQGQPVIGYSAMIKSILTHKRINVLFDVDFFDMSKSALTQFDKIIFTGDFSNKVPYRSTKFIMTEEKPSNWKHTNHPVINLPNHKKYTRRTDFNLLCGVDGTTNLLGKNKKHKICYEEPANINEYNKLYPIHSGQEVYEAEKKKFLNKYNNVEIVLLGRLAQYKYFDMDKAIENAFEIFEKNEGKIKF